MLLSSPPFGRRSRSIDDFHRRSTGSGRGTRHARSGRGAIAEGSGFAALGDRALRVPYAAECALRLICRRARPRYVFNGRGAPQRRRRSESCDGGLVCAWRRCEGADGNHLRICGESDREEKQEGGNRQPPSDECCDRRCRRQQCPQCAALERGCSVSAAGSVEGSRCIRGVSAHQRGRSVTGVPPGPGSGAFAPPRASPSSNAASVEYA